MEIEWTRAGAYVVVQDDDGRVLLTQFDLADHPYMGAWTLPGGGMEWGEQPIDTARRELHEESGLEARIGRLLGVQSNWMGPSDSQLGTAGHALAMLFAATNPVGELKTDFGDDNSTSDARWFTLDEIANLHRFPFVDLGIELLPPHGK